MENEKAVLDAHGLKTYTKFMNTLCDTKINKIKDQILDISGLDVQAAIDELKDEFYSELEGVNTSLADKANVDDVYTKTETDTAVANKVAEIIAGAPEDFDTLKEMSDWISSHEESAAAMNSAIIGKIPIPQTAEVGQVLIVKAVDSSGKPSEWKTVNMGSRYNMTLDSDTATLNITTLDGDA